MILSLLSWAPFLILALIFGIVFTVLGYKRGVIRSLISLASTAVSALLSLLLAKLTASFMSAPLSSLVSGMLPDDLTFGEYTDVLIKGLAQAICACLFFLPIFLILSAILKNVVSALTGKKLKNPKLPGLKLGGIGVSLIDALVFVFVLLLPLYGTLGIAGDALDAVEVLAEEDSEEIEMLSAVTDTLLVKAAGVPPFSIAYDSLVTFRFEGENICLSKTVRTVSDMAGRLSVMVDKSAGEYGENEQKLLDSAEQLIRENRLLRVILCGTLKSAAGENAVLSEYASLITADTIADDFAAFADIIDSAIRNGVFAELAGENKEMSAILSADSALNGEFIYDFTAALNSTENLAKLKASLIRSAVKSVSEDEKYSAVSRALDGISDQPLSAEEARQEGDAIRMILLGMSRIDSGEDSSAVRGAAEMIEGLARHPSIGVETVNSVIDELLPQLGMEGMTSDSTVVSALKDSLKDSTEKPVGEGGFSELTETAVTVVEFVGNIKNGEEGVAASAEKVLQSDPEAIRAMADLITTETLDELGVSQNEKSIQLVQTALMEIAGAELSEDELSAEAAALTASLDKVVSITENAGSQTVTESIPDFEEFLGDVVSSKIISGTIQGITTSDSGGEIANPLGLDVTKSEKATIEKAVKSYYQSNGSDASLADSLNAVCLFFGIDPVI